MPKLIPAIFLATTPLILTSVVMSMPDVRQIATDISVRIDGRSNSGSGAIVSRQGNTYYILTNAHVVNRTQIYRVVTPNGNVYPVEPHNIKRLAGVDLALLSFSSNVSYPVAVLGNSDRKSLRVIRFM